MTDPHQANTDHRGIVSFVRRGQRLTGARERAWAAHRDEWVLDVPRGSAATSIDPLVRFDFAHVFGRFAPLTVEVGTGLGDAITSAAAADPGRNHLGLEVYRPGIAQTLHKIARSGLTNIRLVEVDAALALATAIPESSVEELWVFFPDPWHKTKHRKRRLVTPEFVSSVYRALEPGGRFRIATDWDDYAAHIVEIMARASGFRDVSTTERFPGRALTTFEKRALAAGREIHDFTFVREATPRTSA